MKILLLNNYDSFTYNLYQYLGLIKSVHIEVKNNDQITLSEISKSKYNKIVISPGPGKPEDAILSIQIIKEFGNFIPILGVCLGHQVLAIAYGGEVIKSEPPVHGRAMQIHHDSKTIFTNIPQNTSVMRYHSLEVKKETLPSSLIISASANEGNIIMGLRHKDHPVEGVQFHPESILTKHGFEILKNWVFL